MLDVEIKAPSNFSRPPTNNFTVLAHLGYEATFSAEVEAGQLGDFVNTLRRGKFEIGGLVAIHDILRSRILSQEQGEALIEAVRGRIREPEPVAV